MTTPPSSGHPRPSRLLSDALDDLQQRLSERDQQLPPEQWRGLVGLLECLCGVAEGRITSGYHLSSLDPGMGKTTAMTAFLRALCRSPGDHQGVGVLVGLSLRDEIRAVSAEAGLKESDFAVLTGDAETNNLSSTPVSKARILFTTQAKLRMLGANRPFQDTESFYYQGHARQVRIWDEAFAPADGFALHQQEPGALLRRFDATNPALVKALNSVIAEVETIPDGGVYTVTDLASPFGYDLMGSAKGSAYRLPADEQETIRRLLALSNKTCVVRHHQERRYLVGFVEHLPDDLAPVVILDASGRVRESYRLWEEHRQTLQRLPSAVKDYGNLRIHHWNQGGGKAAFADDDTARMITEAIAEVINGKPGEPWLIIHHKDETSGNITKTLPPLLDDSVKDQVRFLTWGRHHGTNAFADVPNVVLAGTLFYRAMDYEAHWHAGSGIAVESDQRCTDDDRKRVEEGEFRHLVLQALCRGVVRKNTGGQCPPCNAYVIAYGRNIPDQLRTIFPGCQIKPWVPQSKAPKGKVADALTFIETWMQQHPTDGKLPFKAVYEAIGMDTQNFRKSIRQHPMFMDRLARLGMQEENTSRKTAFVRGA